MGHSWEIKSSFIDQENSYCNVERKEENYSNPCLLEIQTEMSDIWDLHQNNEWVVLVGDRLDWSQVSKS